MLVKGRHVPRQYTLIVREPYVDPEPLPTREEALEQVRAGAYAPPPGVRYELDAWELVSTTEGRPPSLS